MKYIHKSRESKLIISLSKGNILAFNTLFKEYSVRLYHFSYGFLKSKSDAEEIVQEVFTKIWQKRGELRYELSFKSYLFTIAFNAIKKHYRTKAQISKYMASTASGKQDNTTSESINYNSLFKHVNELINQLPGRRKEIFIKSRFDGLSNSEISKDLKISKKTVENQLTNALSFIRVNLKEK
jgi:RNA polymerase sigma-70 factor (family 1)